MKRLRFKMAGICLAGLMLLSISGCAENKEDATKDTIKVGVAIYRGDDAFISSVSSYLEEAAKEKEEELGKKIVINIADAKNSQGSQNDLVDDFIGKEYDVICVNMVDRTVAAVIVDKAKEAGIPIIFFNREPVEEDMGIWSQTYYVGTDARDAGELEGKIVADAFKNNSAQIDKNGDGKLQYVMLEGEQVHQDALIRTEYSVKTIINEGIATEKLASGTGNWMRSPAYELMQEWIKTYGNQIEAVISNNDEMALGAIEALEESGMTGAGGPVVAGIDGTKDGLEKITKGQMTGTVMNDARTQAECILEIACACAQGKDPDGKVPHLEGRYVRVPHYTVTPENINEVIENQEKR